MWASRFNSKLSGNRCALRDWVCLRARVCVCRCVRDREECSALHKTTSNNKWNASSISCRFSHLYKIQMYTSKMRVYISYAGNVMTGATHTPSLVWNILASLIAVGKLHGNVNFRMIVNEDIFIFTQHKCCEKQQFIENNNDLVSTRQILVIFVYIQFISNEWEQTRQRQYRIQRLNNCKIKSTQSAISHHDYYKIAHLCIAYDSLIRFSISLHFIPVYLTLILFAHSIRKLCIFDYFDCFTFWSWNVFCILYLVFFFFILFIKTCSRSFPESSTYHNKKIITPLSILSCYCICCMHRSVCICIVDPINSNKHHSTLLFSLFPG